MTGTELEERKQTLADRLKARVATARPAGIDEGCVLLIDTSSSMAESVERGGRDKLSAVKLAIPHLRVVDANVVYGLVGFSNTATIYHELTMGFHDIIRQSDFLYPSGSTNITDAIRAGLELLAHVQAGKKRMILLSDGCANLDVGGIGICLDQCREMKVVIDTIAFGENADRTMLKRIADVTGGLFYDVRDERRLLEVYKELNFSVRYLEHKEGGGR